MFKATVRKDEPTATLKKGDVILGNDGKYRKVIGIGVTVTEWSDTFENASNRPVGDNADYGRTLGENDLKDYKLVKA